MKYFNRDGKFNWVDDNNRFVGFDSRSNCCEDFGWEFTEFDPAGSYIEVFHLDKEFVQKFGSKDEHKEGEKALGWINHYMADFEFFDEEPRVFPSDSCDDGGDVVFRLKNGKYDHEIRWLRIWNHHNGYYAHGFETWRQEETYL